MPMTQKDEEMAMISDLVLGYREGRFGEIIQAISIMKVKAINYEKNLQVEMLFEACDEISQLIEGIRADYKDEIKEQDNEQ